MNLIDDLIRFFRLTGEETKEQTPPGVCPNCWGTQEYDNMIRDLYVEKQIDINNNMANHAFIKDFIVNRIDGIRLVKGVSAYECPTCRISIKK